jgi:FAD dependent oxidoreductase
MRRRTFLAGTGAFFGAAAWQPWSLASQSKSGRTRELRADVVVVGGGLGGCAAALAAAEAGKRVILTEETDWIGGQLTSQAVPPDEHPWIESFGCTRNYRRLRNLIRDYYRQHYPLTAAQRANEYLNPGRGLVSKLCHEPKVALAALNQMLAVHESSGRVRRLLWHVPMGADVEKDRVRAVELRDVRSGDSVAVTGDYFLDATELGDLLPLCKAEYVSGFESQKETAEPHAPAEAQPANMQSFTWCFAIDYLEGEDHTIERPAEYEFWRDYVPQMRPPWPGRLLSWTVVHPQTLKSRQSMLDPAGSRPSELLPLWRYRRIAVEENFAPGTYASDITLVNWPQNDYTLGNLCEVSAEEAARHARRSRQLSLSLLYWLQTAAERPDGKTGFAGLRLRGDLTEGPDGLAKAAYVRESRRIRAEFTVSELHVGLDARRKRQGTDETPRAESFADSVGVGSYRIDLHPSSGGDNYIDIGSLPFQIALGSLIPVRLENLLPACKNLGITHIANGCYRLHPVEWNIGESAGLLAAHCLNKREPPRHVRNKKLLLSAFQRRIGEAGVEIEWPQVRPR